MTTKKISDEDAFLEGVYAVKGDNEAAALVYRHINNLLRNGHFELVDRLLIMVDPSRASINVLLSFLAITWGAKSKLNETVRQNYIRRVRPRMESIKPAQYTSELLQRFG